jgi:hypothetical protein
VEETLIYEDLFPIRDEEARVVSGRLKSGPHLAGQEHPATFSVKTAMPRNGAVVPVLTHNTEEQGGEEVLSFATY